MPDPVLRYRGALMDVQFRDIRTAVGRLLRDATRPVGSGAAAGAVVGQRAAQSTPPAAPPAAPPVARREPITPVEGERIGTERVGGVLRAGFRWEPVVSARDSAESAPGPFPGMGMQTVPETPLEMAARVTGTPMSYLRAVSGQEAGDNPNAKNPRSSATGQFQFVDGTWLAMLRDYGPRYGLPQEVANAIGQDGSVNDPQLRENLLDLRRSPHWSAIMAGELYQQSANALRQSTGRDVTNDEVYAAGHFLGEDVGGWALRQIDNGRGGIPARQAISEYYQSIGEPGRAGLVIAQNPEQFARHMTLQQMVDKQRRGFREHGVRRGVDETELTAPATRRQRASLYPTMESKR